MKSDKLDCVIGGLEPSVASTPRLMDSITWWTSFARPTMPKHQVLPHFHTTSNLSYRHLKERSVKDGKRHSARHRTPKQLSQACGTRLTTSFFPKNVEALSQYE